jgi:hypothetical protein
MPGIGGVTAVERRLRAHPAMARLELKSYRRNTATFLAYLRSPGSWQVLLDAIPDERLVIAETQHLDDGRTLRVRLSGDGDGPRV